MSYSTKKNRGTTPFSWAWAIALAALGCAAGTAANAAVPGITGTTFTLQATQGYSSQPDGMQIYSWGYGCASGFTPVFAPAVFNPPTGLGFCPAMQLPGPTLIVTEGQIVTVTLTNNLPPAAGSTSIVFTGFTPSTTTTAPGSMTATGGTQGVLAMEAANGTTVTYTLNTTGKAGTHAYYSGTQPDLQVEMGMYGALVVLPLTPGVAPGSTAASPCVPLGGRLQGGLEYRNAPAAYDHPATCYDIEYLWQWGEIDPVIHAQAEAQVKASPTCTSIRGCLSVVTEPYHPRYFVINGRSMPDDMDADYAPNYPAQPYNGNPHMHPLDQVLIRTIGQGRWEHPFHEHANHVRILARDGNLILSQTDQTKLAGLMMFNTDTWPGQAFDGIFYWSGKGLGWDIYAHTAANPGNPPCVPDVNGYYTTASGATIPAYNAAGVMISGSPNYYEWCADHDVPLEVNPVGSVGGGGPMTLPDPLVVTNGLWYNGTPYLGPDAVVRSRGPTPLPPGGALQNPPA